MMLIIKEMEIDRVSPSSLNFTTKCTNLEADSVHSYFLKVQTQVADPETAHSLMYKSSIE